MVCDLPPNAVVYLPVLSAEISKFWPNVPLKSALASQSEQETCASLKGKRCWSPYAELKTAREYGFGLGQTTVTASFNNFTEAKKLDSSLRDWQWENRYRADYQLRTMVLTDKVNFNKFTWAHDPFERQAMSFAAYNGGLGGTVSESKMCAAKQGCDRSKWFGNIEFTSKKSRVKYQGYGKSFYEINREYVVNIMHVRRLRYVSFFGEGLCLMQSKN